MMKKLMLAAAVVAITATAQAAETKKSSPGKLEIAAQVLFAPQCTIGWLIDQVKRVDRSKDPNNQKNCWWWSKR